MSKGFKQNSFSSLRNQSLDSHNWQETQETKSSLVSIKPKKKKTQKKKAKKKKLHDKEVLVLILVGQHH
jgi:hypothetical protein